MRKISKERKDLEALFKDKRIIVPSWEDFDELINAILKWRDKWHEECCGEGL